MEEAHSSKGDWLALGKENALILGCYQWGQCLWYCPMCPVGSPDARISGKKERCPLLPIGPCFHTLKGIAYINSLCYYYRVLSKQPFEIWIFKSALTDMAGKQESYL